MPQILILGEWKEISDVAYADDGTVKGFRVKASQLPFVYKGPDVGDFKQWAEAIGVTSAGFALGFLAGPITAIAAGGAAAAAYYELMNKGEGYYSCEIDPKKEPVKGINGIVKKDDNTIFKP